MRLAVLVALGLLSACATRGVQELPELTDWPMRQAVLGDLDLWALRGRIGVRTPDEASSGSLSWQQRGRRFEAEIDGPLGIGGVRMTGDARQVTLSGSRIDTVTVVDPETELWRQTGLRVPVAGLRYWLLGIPIPGVPAALDFGDNALPSEIRQSGWTIRYTEYRQWTLNPLPRRMIAASGGTVLTVIVRDWDIAERAAVAGASFRQEIDMPVADDDNLPPDRGAVTMTTQQSTARAASAVR